MNILARLKNYKGQWWYFLLFFSVLGSPVFAQKMSDENISQRCNAITKVNFLSVVDAPTRIENAEVEAMADNEGRYCKIKASIEPDIGIVLGLPLLDWNGKFFMAGCGGYCGGTSLSACKSAINKGYACIASDMGHDSQSPLAGKNTTDTPLPPVFIGEWGYNNLQAEVDFGFRAIHVVALAGKAITKAFYSKKPTHSYYAGCSTGGRLGMVSAQNFPWDFDGIIAGAPSVNLTGGLRQLLWASMVNQGAVAGETIIDKDDIQLIHNAVLNHCDLDDGIQDGVVGNPQVCGFDIRTLACGENSNDQCLQPPQLAVVNKLYKGPTNSAGEKTYVGGVALGSESQWNNSHIVNPQGIKKFVNDMFRYLAFIPDTGPAWQPSHFDFDHDHKRMGMMEVILGGENPDLRRFKQAGGKLIAYHGWSDVLMSPYKTLDYYNTVQKTMGGLSQTQDFYRLFMVPGMSHCGGGDGANQIEYLRYLEGWVENDSPPTTMTAIKYKSNNPKNTVEFTRQLCPYPQVSVYTGVGSSDEASNFNCQESNSLKGIDEQ